MLAYHNDPKIKSKYIHRVEAHRRADQIVQGFGYWQDGKGCAVGCTLHSASHAAYEKELGIPQIIARLEDRIFEGLPKKEAQAWPSAFLKAIELGADLSGVWPDFAVWLLTDPDSGVLRHAKSNASRKSIQEVADLYFARVPDGDARWSKSRAYAYATDADAAAATHAAHAAYAPYAAPDAAAYVVYAIVAAADAYAEDYADAAYVGASKNWYVTASKKLLSLLAGAK
jgi:hypothetical protein